MKNSIRVGVLVGSTALLGSLAHADQWSDQFPHIKNTGDIAGECSYDAMSKKRLQWSKIDHKHACCASYG